MRIITGTFKGRTIRTVKDLTVRPATDRVRQTIFNMLANRLDMEGARVLDLFAGSGSLGIEALSRGAASATFVESNEQAVDYLEMNVRSLGCEAATEILLMDAMSFLRGTSGPFDLVFADPPYAFTETTDLPEAVFGRNFVRPGGYLLIEHNTDIRFTATEIYLPGPEKKFGRTVVTFFRHQPPPTT